MQLVVEIPDDIIARNLNDTIELSLEVDHKGVITEIYNQEYGFRTLTFASMNCLGKVDILKLKRNLEKEDNDKEENR